MRLGIEIDLKRGVVELDKNKTDDTRPWVIDPAVARAPRKWVALRGIKRGGLMFVDDDGQQLDNSKFAEHCAVTSGSPA
jgi:hypothetical protein